MRRRTTQPDPFDELQRELAQPEAIAPPQVERVGGGYRLTFPEARVLIEVPRVYWHSNGDLDAVYSISILPIADVDSPTRIDHGKLNLQSSSTRARLAKDLGQLHEANWRGILDEAAARISEQVTLGEEPVVLSEVPLKGLPDRKLLGNLCLDKEPSMLFGHGGDGKSYVALAAAVSLATGRALLDIEPTRTLTVAYLDWEWSAEEHAKRMRELIGEQSVPGLYYFPCRKPLPAIADGLAVQFRRLGIQYAIVDSVAWACGGAPEESEKATAFQNALRQLGVGSLTIAHVNRKGDTSMAFGSVFWHASMRSTFFLRRLPAQGNLLILGLYHRKANRGKLDSDTAYVFTWQEGEERVAIARGDARSIPGVTEPAYALRDRIADALRDKGEPMTIKELALALGVSPSGKATSEEAVRVVVTRDKGRTFEKVGPAPGSRAPRVWLAGETLERNTGETPIFTSSAASSESKRNTPLSKGGVSGDEQPSEREREEETATRCYLCGSDDWIPVDGGRLCRACDKLF